MTLTDADKAFRVVRAAQASRRETFCAKSRRVSFLSTRPPNRFSVNVVLGAKRLLETHLDVSCSICGGGYGCLQFEIGSDSPRFSIDSIASLLQSESAKNY